MNKLDNAKRSQVVKCLVDGVSIRGTVRITGVAKNTVQKLLLELGDACSKYMNEHIVNVQSKRVQVDEIWSFIYAKNRNVPREVAMSQVAGDVWTWIAIDADTKLIPSWMIGMRDASTARAFIEDLAGRLANRVQLTTDGLKLYLKAVKQAFGYDVDYAMLVKIYGKIDIEGQRRYSPATCIGCETYGVSGNPDPDHISTSYVERQNLTMRMSMRRFTRLTNGFSKKPENHAAHIALYLMTYNFHRVHLTLKTTPAVKAGITDHV